MSVISAMHPFVPFVSAGKEKSKALSGQRLLKVVFKGRNGEKARTSMCASVPAVDQAEVEANISSFMPYVIQMIEETQNALGRVAILNEHEYVTTEGIGLQEVIAYLEAESKGDRLSGDDIKEWFGEVLRDMLLVAFADKLSIGDSPSEEQTATLERMVNVYRDKFASMAGGRTAFDKVTIGKLQKALELVSEDTVIGGKLSAKLSQMANVSVEEMLGL